MNEIIEKTRELGELIQNSEEMKNAKNAEILQENDDRRITKHLKKCLKNRNQ